MTALIAGYTFIKDNIKWVVLGAALLVFSVVAWKVYDLVQDNATMTTKIVELQREIVIKNLTIELNQKNFQLSQEVVTQRDKEIAELQEQSKSIMFELPSDENDEAPESTRVFLDRLKGITK